MPPDCRRRSHSCDPNCASAVVSHDGKLRVALYTIKHVGYGSVLSYNYQCNTDDKAEFYNSKCLCGAQSCNTLYFSITASYFDAIMDSSHTTLDRFAMLATACERHAFKSCGLSGCDAFTLASVGFGEALFRESPLWLKCYCAQVIQFIQYEREVLPQSRQDGVSKSEADGNYGLRLQNLAITIDRVLSFLRSHPDHLLPPLHPCTDAEIAQKLVFEEQSVWSKLKRVVDRQRNLSLSGLKEILAQIQADFILKQPKIEEAREVLRSTAKALRTTSSTYDPVAAVLEDLAATKRFFSLAQYDRVQAEAPQLSVEDIETGSKLKLESAKLLSKERELSPYFVMEQLMCWDHQPQRKSDVLCFQGVVELPCPVNIMSCCFNVGGVPSEDLQRIADVLAGRFIPKKPPRIIQSLKFAVNVGKAFLGCTALDSRIQQLHESQVFKTQLCHPVLTDSALDQPGKQLIPADKILAQRYKPGSTVLEYLVRWRGNPPQPDSWQPRRNLNENLFDQWRNERPR